MSEVDTKPSAAEPESHANGVTARHNGGPPLDEEHKPEWGHGPIGNYFYWKAAHRAAWHSASRDVILFRMQRAERLGLSYQEYTLEILERGRHLQVVKLEEHARACQATDGL